MADANSNLELPSKLRLPDELSGSTPRSVPNSFWKSEPVKSRRNKLCGYVVGGLICVAIPVLPFCQTVAQYVRPIIWLPYIGLLLGAYGLDTYFRDTKVKRNLNYIRAGECAFARIRELVKMPTTEESSMTITMAIVAHLEMLHPESGEVVNFAVRTSDFSIQNKDKVRTKHRVGDWVPVVWMPLDFENTLQVYEFIEATPESGLIRNTSSLAWKIPLNILLFAAFYICFFSYGFVTGKYLPIDHGVKDLAIPAAIGVGLGLIATVTIAWGFRFEKKCIDEHNREADQTGAAIEYSDYHPDVPAKGNVLFKWNELPAFLSLVSVICFIPTVLIVLIWVCAAYTSNALLDDSNATRVPILITDRSSNNGVLTYTEYSLKYKIVGQKRSHKFLTTRQHQNQFVGPNAIAVLREGYFGWQWVESLEPDPQ